MYLSLIEQLEADFFAEEAMAHGRLKFASERALAGPGGAEARAEVRAAAVALLDLYDTWRRRGYGHLWHRQRHVGPLGAMVFAALTFARLERQALATAPEARRWDLIDELLTAGKIIGAVEQDPRPAPIDPTMN